MNNQENKNDAALQPVQQQSEPALVFDTIEHFENAQRMCKCLSTAGMLPQHFRGDNNVGNCMIALEISQRGKLPVMEVFQNLILVQGRISWFSTYLIGRVNSCGKYSTLNWDSENDGTAQWRMRAKAVELLTGQELVGSWVSLEMAKKENWGAKWNTMPEQMLRYRSAAFWVRAYAPNIAMGIKDQYEVEDAIAEEVPPTPENNEKHDAAVAALRGAVGKKKQPKTEPEDVKPEPQPIVSVVVEPAAAESGKEEAPEAPKTGKDNPYLQRALKNMGLRGQEGAQESSEIDFSSSEQ